MTAVDALDAAGTEDDVAAVLQRTVGHYGLERFCCLTPPADQRAGFDGCVLMNRWPKGWFELYRSAGFHRHDPIVKHTRAQFRSFFWSEAPIPGEGLPARIMAIAAEDFGLRAGISVPVHSISGYQAGISFAGFEIERTAAAKAAVELVAIYAFTRFTQLRAARQGPAKVLTPRQREVLSWTAVGKTARDIAQILSISEDTVNKLVGCAIARLDAANRTHAVVEAIRRKEISI